MAKVGETLRISLIETVYTAAGKPQGEFSFQAADMVHYHADGKMMEKAFQKRRVKMFALNAVEVRRTLRGTARSASTTG